MLLLIKHYSCGNVFFMQFMRLFGWSVMLGSLRICMKRWALYGINKVCYLASFWVSASTSFIRIPLLFLLLLLFFLSVEIWGQFVIGNVRFW